MSRLLFLIAVVVVVYWLLKSYRNSLPGKEADGRAEDMVRCAYCGVHLPKSESIMAGNKYYCDEEHRRAATASPS